MAGWLELPRSTTGSNLLSGTYYGSGNARNYTYLYDKLMYTSMWIAYPLYSSTFSTSTDTSSPDWSKASGIDTSDQINVWSSSYNVFLGETDFSNTVSDGSGRDYYARGHQIADADRQYNSSMLSQTYYAINSTPQIQNGFNGSIWSALEGAARTVAAATDTVYVVTGPCFDIVNYDKTDNVTLIRPKGEGSNGKQCPVPNYYWKVLLKVKRNAGVIESASTIGFWFKHESYTNSNYAAHAVSVNEIEAKTGFDLFANLPDSLEESAESNTSWESFRGF